jgi:hypothetical protein
MVAFAPTINDGRITAESEGTAKRAAAAKTIKLPTTILGELESG